MNYARWSDIPFSTKNTVQTKKKMSSEVASRRKYIAEHTFSITVDPSTKEATMKVESKNAD